MKKVFLWLLIISMVAMFVLSGFTYEVAAQEKERLELAQKYKNAEPGEKFLIGHITFHLSQEYAMMVYQADEQACKQLGLEFIGALASSDEEWITTTESMIAAGAKA